MGTTELQVTKRKELSASALFEIVMSILALICLILPLAHLGGFSLKGIIGNIKLFSYLRIAYNEGIMLWLPFILLIVNIGFKFTAKTSWLSFLSSIFTLFSLIYPFYYSYDFAKEIDGLNSTIGMYGGDTMFSLSIGFFLMWLVLIILIMSIFFYLFTFIAYKLQPVKKYNNTIDSENSKIKNEKRLSDRKNKLAKLIKNIAKVFQKLPHKKEIAIGALALIAIVAGVSMCAGNGSDTSGETKLQTWDKFVKITADGVNLRKEPDTNSARLMKEAVDLIGNYTVTWTPQEPIYEDLENQPYHIRINNVCPVVDETKEWYKIYIEGYHAYIMKKFCKEVTPEPIKDKEYHYYYNVRKIETDLTGSYLMSSTNYESGEAKVLLKLGYVKDNAYVFNKTIIVDEAERIGKEAFKLYVHPHFEDTRLALPQSYFDGQRVILDKITGKQIEEWFASIKEHNNEIYYCFDGEIFNY